MGAVSSSSVDKPPIKPILLPRVVYSDPSLSCLELWVFIWSFKVSSSLLIDGIINFVDLSFKIIFGCADFLHPLFSMPPISRLVFVISVLLSMADNCMLSFSF